MRLIESYRDVSREVLSVIGSKMTHAQRSRAVEERIKRLEVDVEKANPGRRAEVAEMFRGKTYVLFVYNYIKDVRLVYAPPRAIGEFGGEADNWMWPRHTGDFAFMRAYVAPDGSNADYAPQNVPFRPRKHLQVAAAGVKAGDFVFALGYPGSTHRHKSSHYLAFEEEVRLPFVVDLFRWIIDVKEKMSAGDRATAIKLSSSLKGLWNTLTRSLGQLKGLKDLRLADKRRADEAELQRFIAADPARRRKYGSLLGDLGRAYADMTARAPRDMVLANLVSSRTSTLLGNAFRICEASCRARQGGHAARGSVHGSQFRHDGKAHDHGLARLLRTGREGRARGNASPRRRPPQRAGHRRRQGARRRRRPGQGHRRLPGKGLRRHPAEEPGNGERLAEKARRRAARPWTTRSSPWPSPSIPITAR